MNVAVFICCILIPIIVAVIIPLTIKKDEARKSENP
jgi:hypothetical protein